MCVSRFLNFLRNWWLKKFSDDFEFMYGNRVSGLNEHTEIL